MTKIKICGLTRPEDIQYVNEARPDYIGFVFAESRRRVTIDQAAGLREMLHASIRPVGVFVNEPAEQIAEICRRGIIDIVQLHGDEDEGYIRRLRTLTGHPVLKAVRVRCREDILKAEQLPCERLLLDTYSKRQYGGCGEVFSWELIPASAKPYFLAGGLTAENIETAVRTLRPYAVDVSSGVETGGYKDPQKIFELIERVRSVE
ncbi:phosphoribosylanthranilate isomerase [Candidatus Soleaferrea massiliensis]|uniref:phosphoribosylanthranilate isomerase n=1 Tax=Candidatus Soleaferrea massiliensis TaxID=1470354 RepID=UPI00059164D6|nr:phosphoribosylanthranilate isomerase [Candidatus Soleaferrea massiliensis]